MWTALFGCPSVSGSKLARHRAKGKRRGRPLHPQDDALRPGPCTLTLCDGFPSLLIDLVKAVVIVRQVKAVVIVGGRLAANNPSFVDALSDLDLLPPVLTSQICPRNKEIGLEDRSMGWGWDAEQQRERGRRSALLRRRRRANGTASQAELDAFDRAQRKGLEKVSVTSALHPNISGYFRHPG